MFRDMVRKKQKLSHEECISVLIQEKRGVLSVLGDENYPYGVPINHYYNREDGHVYFHSGKRGHKIDAMAASDKVSLCVYDGGSRKKNGWALTFRSVIVFGRVRLVEDYNRAMDISRKLCYKFTEDEAYIAGEIEKFGKATAVYEIVPEHITGKTVTEE